MLKSVLYSFMALIFLAIAANYGSTELPLAEQLNIEKSELIEIAKKDRLYIGMSKTEAYEVEGVPYRVRRLKGEEGKEMWVYRCNNEDGFDEDCLYLYFGGDELDKIERP